MVMKQIQKEIQIAELRNKAVAEQKIISQRQEYERQIKKSINNKEI